MPEAPYQSNEQQVVVIVPAAGKGVRMGLETPKQFLQVGGKPILVRTLETILQIPKVICVVAVHQDYVEYTGKLLQRAELNQQRIQIVEGKEERQHTVAHALASVTLDPTDIVLVHDAVRPFASVELFNRVIQAVREFGACVPVLPVTDTIKEISGTTISATVSRDVLRRAQTPQGFSAELLQRAFVNTFRLGLHITDESSAVEKIHSAVKIVDGEEQNIKITTSADLFFAEYYAKL